MPSLPWQAELPKGVLQLRDIKRQMTRNLSRMPNYTCLETIVRSRHESDKQVIAVAGKSVPFRRVDVVRLEVAEVGGDELFARPGEHNFRDLDFADMVQGGLMGNGIFSGFARDVFLSNSATYRFIGEEQIDGRKMLRYDFQIPQLLSGYRVGSDQARAIVGYHGSFWADPQTFEAVRLDTTADDVPSYTGIAGVTNRVDFARVRIGASDALLPQSAMLNSRLVEGRESRNEVSFTHCREYGVESVISFGDQVDPAGGKPGSGTNEVDIPPGTLLTIALETPVDSDTAHVGDAIAGRVDVEVKHKSTVLIPKDAVVSGRLRRLDKHLEGWPYVLAELEFSRLEFEGRSARFFAVLEKIVVPEGVALKRVPAPDLPGVGTISVTGNRLLLPEGLRMIWKTISYQQAAEAGTPHRGSGGNVSRARPLHLALGMCLLFPALLWQDELPHEVVMLRRIKNKMAANLSRVPNYTCLETINRGARAPERLVIAVPGKQVPFRRKDVMRLEVAEVGGHELYADAGAHVFEKSDIRDFMRGGLLGNGTFTAFANILFVSDIPTFHYVGEEQINGRTLLRYDYTVPQFMSGYQVGTNLGWAMVAYHGSFWADPQTLDAVRIEVDADEVPEYTGLSGAWDRVDYAISRIGSADVLLPLNGELRTRDLKGWESANQIAFTHCREYGVQAVIKFDNDADSTDGGSGGTKYVELPSGLQMTLTLETPLDAATAHIGDVLAASVQVDARHKGTVVVPKDAVVTGRLRLLEHHKEGWPYVLAGLEFIQLEFEGKQTRFFAELEKIVLPAGAGGPRRVSARDLPGVGMVSATGNNLRLPKGTQMIWKTISYAQAAAVVK